MKYLFTIMLFAVVTLGLSAVPARDCPKASPPEDVPFAFDETLVNYELLAAFAYPAGAAVAWDVNTCDPDGDPVTIAIESGPQAMIIEQTEPNRAKVTWQTTAADIGVHYIDLVATDSPPADTDLPTALPGQAGGPKQAKRTVLAYIYRENAPPVFTGCTRLPPQQGRQAAQ